MGNIYGVANPLATPAAYATVAGADVACPSATETTVITTGALVAVSPGRYYPLIWATLVIVLGGTAPSALVAAFKLGSGSDVDAYTVEPGLLVNSAELVIPFPLIGVSSGSAWIGSGSTINVTVTPTGQAVTTKFVGSRAVVALFRGPD